MSSSSSNNDTITTSSDARIAANRANSRLSTGPKSDAGKLASSRNALHTGLTSARLFALPGEDSEALQHLTASVLNDLNPSGALEEYCATAIIHALWNLRRCANLEAELQQNAALQGVSDPIHAPEMCGALDRIYRYRKMHESSLRKASLEMRRLQTERHYRAEVGIDSTVDGGTTSVLVDTRAAAHDVQNALKKPDSNSGSLTGADLPPDVREFVGLTPSFEALTRRTSDQALEELIQRHQPQPQRR